MNVSNRVILTQIHRRVIRLQVMVMNHKMILVNPILNHVFVRKARLRCVLIHALRIQSYALVRNLVAVLSHHRLNLLSVRKRILICVLSQTRILAVVVTKGISLVAIAVVVQTMALAEMVQTEVAQTEMAPAQAVGAILI